MAICWGGNSVTMYDITVGAMAAVPIPTTNRAKSRKTKEEARALRIFPKVKTIIPSNRVFRLPRISTILPKIGAHAAVEIAWDKAVQVVLLYGRFISRIKAGPKTVLSPPIIPTRNAAKPYERNPF